MPAQRREQDKCAPHPLATPATPQWEIALDRGQRLGQTGRGGLVSVADGLIAVSTVLADGRRQILCLNAPGETICPVCSTGCWVEALAPSRLQVDPVSHDALGLQDLFRLTHERLISANAHLLTLGRLDGAERVAAFIADMCERIGRPFGASGAVLNLPMTRDDVADYLGLNAETVSRLFSKLKRNKVVLFSTPTEMIVPDLAALEARFPAPMVSGANGRRNGHNGSGA